VALPLTPVVPQAVQAVRRGHLVLVAPPGAGKTTLLPPALLDADLGEVWVTEPRRLAARMAATRVAAQLGEQVGARCGYQVRFESAIGPDTRLRFLTEGMLLRHLRNDPELRQVGVVVFDEFHERHLEADLSLALLRRVAERRSDLRLVAMSATMDAAPIARWLDAPVLHAEGRAHPVEIEYAPDGRRPLEIRIARAFERLVASGTVGHVLVFLPGAREIRRTEAACRSLAERAGFAVAVLHGDLSREQQDRALAPGGPPRLILSTNVAETSITIDGVGAVIDSGLARIPGHDPWSGFPRLSVGPISRASAEQRAGRAGRTGPGRCVRLFDRHDLERRPAHDPPEILRSDLTGLVLEVLAAGIPDPARVDWLTPPPAAALAGATALLRRLGAVEDRGLSDEGRSMLRFPVHPRLAKLLVECERRGASTLGAGAAAVLSEGPLLRAPDGDLPDADADVLVELARIRSADDRAARGRVERLQRRLAAAMATTAVAKEPETALRLALLSAFPDRVARARADGTGGRTLRLAAGGSARQSPASAVRTAEWVVGLTLEERRELGRAPVAMVRSVSAIEPEWLLELFPQEIEDVSSVEFDARSERVVARSELRFGALAVVSSELARPPAEAGLVLAAAARTAGWARFVADPAALTQWVARVAFARAHDPRIPALEISAIEETLDELCAGCTSFAELERAGLHGAVVARLGEHARVVDRLAPARVTLPHGRTLPVGYERDRAPFVSSRLQDFFGLREGPTVADGRVPVVLHLRAPNGRDVQVTTDLRGFWSTHYPALRTALMRRYPKHAWPDDPASARPPAPGRPRARGR
jgi:ATP-dependent helicase HrpB